MKKEIHVSIGSAMIFTLLMMMTGCTGVDKPETDNISLDIHSMRFEKDLFSKLTEDSSLSNKLKQRYGSYYELFVWQLTRLGSKNEKEEEANVRRLAADTAMRSVYESCEQQFPDFHPYDEKLTEAFKLYRYYFPEKNIPQLLTTVSLFSYPVICDSTHLAISLDMYLDPGCRFYETLEPPLPNYLRRRMRPEYIVADALKGWAQSDYAADENQSDLLQSMISEGRIWYFLNKVLPETSDTIISGYTAEQLSWCSENENQIWSFFISQKLLYSKDPNVLLKYVGEGPTTNGFPPSSPGNIGQYVGYRIISSYMKEKTKMTLKELMEEKDLARIFRESRYKPKR